LPQISCKSEAVTEVTKTVDAAKDSVATPVDSDSDKFSFSEKILLNRGVSVAELEQINGTGKDGRVTKNDILEYAKIE
jgi:2-oxoglutarate dehydrogenase E2 component (dihydrolipoamide succinyltransferase)